MTRKTAENSDCLSHMSKESTVIEIDYLQDYKNNRIYQMFSTLDYICTYSKSVEPNAYTPTCREKENRITHLENLHNFWVKISQQCSTVITVLHIFSNFTICLMM
jgi:hypothetical protein